MKAITLRNLPPEIEKVVRKEADRQRTSINKSGHKLARAQS